MGPDGLVLNFSRTLPWSLAWQTCLYSIQCVINCIHDKSVYIIRSTSIIWKESTQSRIISACCLRLVFEIVCSVWRFLELEARLSLVCSGHGLGFAKNNYKGACGSCIKWFWWRTSFSWYKSESSSDLFLLRLQHLPLNQQGIEHSSVLPSSFSCLCVTIVFPGGFLKNTAKKILILSFNLLILFSMFFLLFLPLSS